MIGAWIRADVDPSTDRSSDSTLGVISAVARAAVISLSFWTAVCLPVVLITLLVVGIDTLARAGTFLAVTTVEVFALALGSSYPPGPGTADRDG